MRETRLLIESMPPFPNNNDWELVLYKEVFAPENTSPDKFEGLFHGNNWGNSWRNGVYPYHHFHSSAHEVLGCYGGSGAVQFGGPRGPVVELKKGDAVFIPAGVAHCLQSSTERFHVVGAYPRGTFPDMCLGEAKDYDEVQKRIISTPGDFTLPLA